MKGEGWWMVVDGSHKKTHTISSLDTLPPQVWQVAEDIYACDDIARVTEPGKVTEKTAAQAGGAQEAKAAA